MNYKNKKLLILGGAYLHNKVVEAANEMEIYTIVTDNLPDAPAKKIASKSYNINVSDVDKIVEMSKEEGVDAVLTVCLDFCQIYYHQICERLGLPCYGTYEQFQIFTNKELFKKICTENGVDIIPTYTEDELSNLSIYPVLVKPAHNRGSRGQSVCCSETEARNAIRIAQDLSDDGHAIIEKYMGEKEDFQVTYLVIDGEAYVVRTADRYLGPKEENMDRVAIALSSPSSNSDLYMDKVHQHVVDMLNAVGIRNAPVFMQGFVDGDTVRFYDPGLRFPGGDYDRIFTSIMGVNLMKLLIELAFTGEIKRTKLLTQNALYLKGHTIFTLHSAVRPGKIKSITEKNTLLHIDGVDFVSFRHNVGDEVAFTGTVSHRIAEFNISGSTPDAVRKTVQEVEDTLVVLDEQDKDMIFCKFDTNTWRAYEGGRK